MRQLDQQRLGALVSVGPGITLPQGRLIDCSVRTTVRYGSEHDLRASVPDDGLLREEGITPPPQNSD
jgi:hypothetical protein